MLPVHAPLPSRPHGVGTLVVAELVEPTPAALHGCPRGDIRNDRLRVLPRLAVLFFFLSWRLRPSYANHKVWENGPTRMSPGRD